MSCYSLISNNIASHDGSKNTTYAIFRSTRHVGYERKGQMGCMGQ